MVPNDRNDRIWKFDRRQDVSADAGVQFHFVELKYCEASWLIEYVLRNRQLSHVVKQSRSFERLNLFFLV